MVTKMRGAQIAVRLCRRAERCEERTTGCSSPWVLGFSLFWMCCICVICSEATVNF